MGRTGDVHRYTRVTVMFVDPQPGYGRTGDVHRYTRATVMFVDPQQGNADHLPVHSTFRGI